MNRNERTTIDKLVLGDRFYFPTDPERLVWEIPDRCTRRYATGKTTYKAQQDLADRAKEFDGTTRVVFLRNARKPL